MNTTRQKQIEELFSTDKDIIVNVRITGDGALKALNKKYLKRDYTTDVLSFSLDEQLENGDFLLGDVIVNKEQAKKQSKEYGNDQKHEIAELIAHGVLHLLEVHHNDDDESGVHGVK